MTALRSRTLIEMGPRSRALNLLIWGVIQQCVYETVILDIDNLRKRLMQTWFDFEQDIIDAVWSERLRPCACWWRTL